MTLLYCQYTCKGLNKVDCLKQQSTGIYVSPRGHKSEPDSLQVDMTYYSGSEPTSLCYV